MFYKKMADWWNDKNFFNCAVYLYMRYRLLYIYDMS